MQKNLVATLYIKNGMAVNGFNDFNNPREISELAKIYNDSGIDKVICWDLSDDDDEHEKNVLAIRDINRNTEIKTAAGGNIKRIEDIKQLFYAGCCEVILNGSKKDTINLLNEAVEEFGPEKMLVSVKNIDFLFKNQQNLTNMVHELLIMEKSLFEGLENITDIPYIINFEKYDKEKIVSLLQSPQVRGISGGFLNDVNNDIQSIKAELSEAGIKMDNFEAKLNWSELKLNSDGMVPVIVQDYQSNEVLMLAYMNEEAFNTTIKLGKMTYWSRSRNELWVKGLTSGHIQYVKSLTADCDKDTILAKVSQVGAACHTGNRSCFFNEIVKKEYVEKQPVKVFEAAYKKIVDRKNNPKKGSYTSDLFEAGLDAILKKCGEESTEITLAAKNHDSSNLTHEMADYLYNLMMLMVECNLTWDELREELSNR